MIAVLDLLLWDRLVFWDADSWLFIILHYSMWLMLKQQISNR